MIFKLILLLALETVSVVIECLLPEYKNISKREMREGKSGKKRKKLDDNDDIGVKSDILFAKSKLKVQILLQHCFWSASISALDCCSYVMDYTVCIPVYLYVRG